MTLPAATQEKLDLAALRARLESSQGQDYWRSLEELADSSEFRAFLHHEFPSQLPEWLTGVDRRGFLRIMGASLALAGLSACTRQPTERIVPYVQPPEGLVPGKPLFFATSMPMAGTALPLLVESHMGRPTKIEGNPQHPASLGAADLFAQASILSLYDPDRSRSTITLGRSSQWSSFQTAIAAQLEVQRLKKGAGLRLLTGAVTSPTLGDQILGLLAEMPEARWCQFEAVGRDAAREGVRLACGEPLNVCYRLEKAKVIVSLDADFLSTGPGSLRYARAFAAARRVTEQRREMNRLYVLESCPSNTGAMADHRLAIGPSELQLLTQTLAAAVGVAGVSPATSASERHNRWIEVIARDLKKHAGECLILVGDQQPPDLHALAHSMNAVLRNVGSTLYYTEPLEIQAPGPPTSLRQLVDEMQAGKVELLVISGVNPAYSAPGDLRFADHLRKIPLRIHHGLYQDETAALCQWHVPQSHYLEAWGDLRAFEGTVSLQQPLIAPLYESKSALELIAALRGQADRGAYELLRDFWKRRLGETGFEKFWQTALHDGFVTGTELPAREVAPKTGTEILFAPSLAESGSLALLFRPDPSVWDGCFANNGWLQELPRPITKLTWDNPVLLSPRAAERLDLSNEDLVDLHCGETTLRAAVWIVPGHADDSVTLHLGYGRTRAGKVGNGAGFDAYRIQVAASPWCRVGLRLTKTGERYSLSCTQHHHSMEGRDLIRAGSLDQFMQDPKFAQHSGHGGEAAGEHLSLYPEHPKAAYAWGMVVDLNSCTGCNACVLACQSENNIPVVGKEQVAKGREMQWIRIDRYFQGGLDAPAIHHQPVMCHHCENAPCEVVCPVGATVHSPEGLNEMVYNRCVGTRYCSNNCPYKVRRFNFLLFQDFETPSLKMMRNPDVSVRSRGVMEKCTYCVQRINTAKIEAEKEDRQVRDGEVVTACQQTCPSEAIIFGDLNDPQSRISQLQRDPRKYALLTELNVQPRTSYLARLRNPNPEIPEERPTAPAEHGNRS